MEKKVSVPPLKRTFFILMVIVLGVTSIAVIHWMVDAQLRAREVILQRGIVSEDLKIIHKEFASIVENGGDVPEDIGQLRVGLSRPASEYELFPEAKGQEPLARYIGKLEYASGYVVLRNGIITNGKIKFGIPRRQKEGEMVSGQRSPVNIGVRRTRPVPEELPPRLPSRFGVLAG